MLSTPDPPTPISRTHLLRTGLETLVEGDSSRPAFTKLVAADRKILVSDPAGNAIRVAYPNSNDDVTTQHATRNTQRTLAHAHTLDRASTHSHIRSLTHTRSLMRIY